MNLPFALGTIPLPDWLPAWVPVVLLIPLLVYALLVLAMPFAILGTRSRLEAIEAQLDDLHAELRALSLHFGPPPDLAPRGSVGGIAGPRGERGGRAGGARAEPRLGWSRDPDA